MLGQRHRWWASIKTALVHMYCVFGYTFWFAVHSIVKSRHLSHTSRENARLEAARMRTARMRVSVILTGGVVSVNSLP